jgi:hypothetical protein
LPLSSLPDPGWIRAFDAAASVEASVRSFVASTPKVRQGQIIWTISETDLFASWNYVNVCIDSANASGRHAFPLRTSLVSDS